MSVTSNFGAKPCFLSSLRISRSAARLSRRRWTRHVEDLALVIDGTPQIHPLASDPNHHLVEVPAIAWAGPPLAQPSREHRSELQHPAPYRLIGDIEPAVDE